ncbi:MAG: 50S ribosomal protein L15 [Ruminiclostridium sp.]|jgi:large subunit ribosomal protein L15|nr:50S ribosomal protein L15 [Ruminiclostridium sp.]
MNLSELKPGAPTQKAYRKGRGPGSGNGKTGGRGHKGQGSRSGGGARLGFEGGQMPLYRRLPKRGFNNIFGKTFTEVKLSDLESFDNGTVVNAELLVEKGMIKKVNDGIVILGSGELTRNLTVQAARFTKTAQQKIEAAGGKAEVV